MGKRKAARKPVTRLKAKLDIAFNCLYCNHEKSVEVKMEKKKQTATLRCKVCQESWQTTINALSHPVDVYSDWVDACEAAQQDHDAENRNKRHSTDSEAEHHIASLGGDDWDDLEEDDLDDYEARRSVAQRNHMEGIGSGSE